MTGLQIEDRAPDWLRSLKGGADEVLWNLRGLHRAWQDYPDGMDFLDPSSPNHAFKQLQTRLYRELLGDLLEPEAGRGLRILDAACGVGRFTVPLLQAGHEVVAIDACRPSLEAARRHLAEAAAGDPGLSRRARLVWGDIDSCDALDGLFERIVALELLCYLPDPQSTARRLASMLAPGGSLILSVEAWPGALLTDSTGLSLADLTGVLQERVLAEENERWVRVVDASDLGAILRGAGLEVVQVAGTHFVPDGPLMSLLDVAKLGEERYTEEVVRLEALLRDDEALGAIPRALLGVAVKPHGESAPCA